MPAQTTKRKITATPPPAALTPDQVAEALEMIRGLDWADYWRRVDEGVAKEVDAYAAWRARSLEEFGHCVLR